MHRQHSHSTWLNRGRKAGLNTREIYSALGASEARNDVDLTTHADCNGYVLRYTEDGQSVYVPVPDASAQ